MKSKVLTVAALEQDARAFGWAIQWQAGQAPLPQTLVLVCQTSDDDAQEDKTGPAIFTQSGAQYLGHIDTWA